ncbi:MAG: hypothetical protein ACXVR1_03605 [Solirubrobacteraceae bacterium]
MLAFATIGSAALYLLFIWLLSAAGAAWMAQRKGYTERVGLLFGLLLSAVGFVIVLLLPARPGSTWKTEGPFPNPGARRPLGIPALGPVAGAPDTPEAAGPALPDASVLHDASAPADTSAGDAPADEPPPRGDV